VTAGVFTSDRRLAKQFPFATPAWTFRASVAPWWSLDGLIREASPVRFIVQDTMSLIDRGEALP
jgi:hypothetical protein